MEIVYGIIFKKLYCSDTHSDLGSVNLEVICVCDLTPVSYFHSLTRQSLLQPLLRLLPVSNQAGNTHGPSLGLDSSLFCALILCVSSTTPCYQITIVAHGGRVE